MFAHLSAALRSAQEASRAAGDPRRPLRRRGRHLRLPLEHAPLRFAGIRRRAVNYHGSSGFGFAFRDSIMGRQGQLETQDIEAATDWLLSQPWADAGRVFAAGGSYGGFLVAWMNGHVPAGRYRAYVCHAGSSTACSPSAPTRTPSGRRTSAALYWENAAKVRSQSPSTFAHRMDTPTLVIHGNNDYRVPDANGLAYYNTLQARGVPARLVWFPDENHWVLKPRNSNLWYGEVFDWLAAHDPGGGSRKAR